MYASVSDSRLDPYTNSTRQLTRIFVWSPTCWWACLMQLGMMAAGNGARKFRVELSSPVSLPVDDIDAVL